jgi:hypothetical protein
MTAKLTMCTKKLNSHREHRGLRDHRDEVVTVTVGRTTGSPTGPVPAERVTPMTAAARPREITMTAKLTTCTKQLNVGAMTSYREREGGPTCPP